MTTREIILKHGTDVALKEKLIPPDDVYKIFLYFYTLIKARYGVDKGISLLFEALDMFEKRS